MTVEFTFPPFSPSDSFCFFFLYFSYMAYVRIPLLYDRNYTRFRHAIRSSTTRGYYMCTEPVEFCSYLMVCLHIFGLYYAVYMTTSLTQYRSHQTGEMKPGSGPGSRKLDFDDGRLLTWSLPQSPLPAWLVD